MQAILASFLGINQTQLWLELEKHFAPLLFLPIKVPVPHKEVSMAQKVWIFLIENIFHTSINIQVYQDLVEDHIYLDHQAGTKS